MHQNNMHQNNIL